MNTINKSGIRLSVNVNGRPVSTFLHEGKYFIESREGTEYTIEIHNENSYRVEAVVSVDGLSVITGKLASTSDIGYLINAWNKISVKGFRKDNETVGAFKFTKKEKSYAKSKGLGANVGVIALAVYKEKEKKPDPVLQAIYHYHDYNWVYPKPILPTYDPNPTRWYATCGDDIHAGVACSDTQTYSCNLNNAAPAAQANYCSVDSDYNQRGTPPVRSFCSVPTKTPKASFDHGTTWGAKIADKVTNVEFDRGYQLFTQEIFYNSKENLELMGIKFVQEKQVAFPKGFPSDYATPPEGWDG